MTNNHTFYDYIEEIVTVESLTNKWLMWAETYLPDQSVYVPSIFQLRDAESHLIEIFAYGLTHKYITEKTSSTQLGDLFVTDNTFSQLNEIFVHLSRAFYDCADYICIAIKDELDKSDISKKSRIISNLITDCRSTRSSKSKVIEENYSNILRYDSLLEKISTAYILSDTYNYIPLYKNIQKTIAEIEYEYEKDYIISHMKDFYTIKTQIASEYQNHDDSDIFDGLDKCGVIAHWHEERKEILQKRYVELESILIDMKALKNALEKSPEDAKRISIKKTFKSIFQPVRTLVMALLSGIISCVINMNLYYQPATPTSTIKSSYTLNINFLFNSIGVFIVIFLAFSILSFIIYFIKKKFKKF